MTTKILMIKLAFTALIPILIGIGIYNLMLIAYILMAFLLLFVLYLAIGTIWGQGYDPMYFFTKNK
jgi:hypothetical protein